MAQRRMFSLKVIDTDMFLDMSPTAQLLYFHLAMRADDDGFVASPKRIAQMVSPAADDLKILAAKQFIIPFRTGVIVIRHWRENNYIQNDRKHDTIYKEEMAQLSQDSNGVYLLDTKCIQDVSKMDTEVRLGKVRIGKVKGTYPTDFEEFWEEYPKKVEKAEAFREWVKLKPSEEVREKILAAVQRYKKTKEWKEANGKFIVYLERFLKRRKWEDEVPEVKIYEPTILDQ